MLDMNVGGDLVTAVGTFFEVGAGEELVLYGKWGNHSMFGRQFQAESYESRLPDNAASLLRYLSAGMIEFVRKSRQSYCLYIEIVCIDIQTRTVTFRKLLFCILKKKSCFSDSSGSLYANKTFIPINFVHKVTPDWSIKMPYKIFMCPEKRLHRPIYYFYKRLYGKVSFFNNKCKPDFTKKSALVKFWQQKAFSSCRETF